MAAYPVFLIRRMLTLSFHRSKPKPFNPTKRFDLKKVFEKRFDGTGFLQWYKPTFKGVAMAEKLYDNLTGVEAEPEMPHGPAATTGEGDD
ncbi:hypothetical protein PQX77_019785 [Marasmius sp. AFHP31]|nr:hypothetical protein PQX77_019785 [Marasmius sp. AFHP31]